MQRVTRHGIGQFTVVGSLTVWARQNAAVTPGGSMIVKTHWHTMLSIVGLARSDLRDDEGIKRVNSSATA